MSEIAAILLYTLAAGACIPLDAFLARFRILLGAVAVVPVVKAFPA